MALLEKIATSFTYAEYATLIDRLHADGKVTGHEQSADLLAYSLHNRKRMERLEKTFAPSAEVSERLQSAIKSPMIWLTITEGWCGDASQIVTVIDKLAKSIPHVEHRIILRDDNPEIIDQFLTNGGRAIPKTIFLDAQTGEVLGHWGPRPIDAQAIIQAWKTESANVTAEEKAAMFEDAKLKLHTWYAHNKGVAIQNELMEVVEACMKPVAV